VLGRAAPLAPKAFCLGLFVCKGVGLNLCMKIGQIRDGER
jgi:hypothetical protein